MRSNSYRSISNAVLTKREVKMAGYRPSSFFVRFYGPRRIWVQHGKPKERTRLISSHHERKGLVNTGFIKERKEYLRANICSFKRWHFDTILFLNKARVPKIRFKCLLIIFSCNLHFFIWSLIFSTSSSVFFVKFVKRFLRQSHLFYAFLIPHIIAHSSCIQSQFPLRIITFVGQFT